MTSISQFGLSVLFGSGGSRTVVASAGSVMAIHLVNQVHPGRIRIEWCGGISGGSIIAAMLAAKLPPPTIVDYAIETDYQSYLTWHGSYLRILNAFLKQKVYEETRPCKGVLNPDKLRLFLEKVIGEYPSSFWAMSVSGNSQIVFTNFGVFEIFDKGNWEKLAEAPPSVGTAIVASCAVPGIIDAVSLYGRYLFDGALSKYGSCPIDIALKYMNIPAEKLLAVDVGEDFDKENKSHTMWDALFGIDKLRRKEKEAAAKAPPGEKKHISVKPKAEGFCGLQFVVPAHLKWKALMESFFETIKCLEEVGIATPEVRLLTNVIAAEYAPLLEIRHDAEFVTAVKKMLTAHGLYQEQVNAEGEPTRVTDKTIALPEQPKQVPAKPNKPPFKPIERLKSAVSQIGLRAGRWISERFSR